MTNQLESLLDFAKSHVPFHQRRAPERHRVLADWPLMTRHDLVAYSLDKSDDLLSHPRPKGGCVIASGGTTAKPKYVFYAHSEMAAVVRNIANHFLANGIEPGDSVVNYFTSGDMWTSFLLADRVLSALPVTVFSLGYSPKMDGALDVLERFKPNTIVGIPSMILSLARHCAEQRKQVRMQKVFYAGEAVVPAAMDLLTSVWGCRLIRSASYASTDAGSIGWQCPHCKAGEHYVFDDTCVEIVDGEIVVTSLVRRAMPVIRYCTGDGGEWVAPPCDCGRGAPLLKLLGRIDNVILIWGLRILYDQIVAALDDAGIGYTAAQVHAYSRDCEQFLLVKFESQSPLDAEAEARLRDMSYERCGDIKETATREMLDSHLFFKSVPVGTLERNERTGKAIPVIDSRD